MSHDDDTDATLKGLEDTSNRLFDAVTSLAKRLNTAEGVTRELKRQQELIKEQQTQTKTQKKINGWLMLSIALDVVLSIGLGFGFFRIDHNADSISQIQDRVSAEVLCPQYQLWLALINERRSEPDLTPKQKQQIDQFGNVFEQGYRSLDCKPNLPGDQPK